MRNYTDELLSIGEYVEMVEMKCQELNREVGENRAIITRLVKEKEDYCDRIDNAGFWDRLVFLFTGEL